MSTKARTRRRRGSTRTRPTRRIRRTRCFCASISVRLGNSTIPTGKVLDGDNCSARPAGALGENVTVDRICDIGNWNEVRAQARTLLGIRLLDPDVFNVPLILTDPYGHFKPGPHGYPQVVIAGTPNDAARRRPGGERWPRHQHRRCRQDRPRVPRTTSRTTPPPNAGLAADDDTDRQHLQPGDRRDDAAPDARHLRRRAARAALRHRRRPRQREHRAVDGPPVVPLRAQPAGELHRIHASISSSVACIRPPKSRSVARCSNAGSGWGYNERLFQAARFCTEMQYQHLVFEEFARTIQPLINPFLGGLDVDQPGDHARSSRTRSIASATRCCRRKSSGQRGQAQAPRRPDSCNNDVRLLTAFLNPTIYHDGGPCATGSQLRRRTSAADRPHRPPAR